MATLLELAKTEVQTAANNFIVSGRAAYAMSKAKANTGSGIGVNFDPLLQAGVDLYNGLGSLLRDENDGFIPPPNNDPVPFNNGAIGSEYPAGTQGNLYFEWITHATNDWALNQSWADTVISTPIEIFDGNRHQFHKKIIHSGGTEQNLVTDDRQPSGIRNVRFVPIGEDPNNTPPEPENPDYPINIGGSPGGLQFGTPYIDENGDLHLPFTASGDGWALPGSVNTSDGSINFGLGATGDGGTDGPPLSDDNGDGKPDIEDCICGDGSDENSWPITVPKLLTQKNEATESLAGVPQAIAWMIRNFDAISGQYPIEIELKDTDPLQEGDQSQTISLPNQAEAMAEIFGLAYEANTNSELAINILFRLVPEIMAAKNSTLTTQDYVLAMTNWLGFRTKNVERKIFSNFNPLQARSMPDLLQESIYEIQGVEDDDPHTLVEWLTQLKFAAAIMKASVFRGAGQEENIAEEVTTVAETQPAEESSKVWEKFVDALNSQQSNLTDRNLHPRPRVTSVDDVLNPGTVLPDRSDD